MTKVDHAIEQTEGLLEETHTAVLRAEVLRLRAEITNPSGKMLPRLTPVKRVAIMVKTFGKSFQDHMEIANRIFDTIDTCNAGFAPTCWEPGLAFEARSLNGDVTHRFPAQAKVGLPSLIQAAQRYKALGLPDDVQMKAIFDQGWPGACETIKAGTMVVPALTDEDVDAYMWSRNYSLVDSDEDWVRWSRRVGRWAYALAISRLSTIPSGRVLGDKEIAADEKYLDALIHVRYVLFKHMADEGGVPMTDALASAIERIEAHESALRATTEAP